MSDLIGAVIKDTSAAIQPPDVSRMIHDAVDEAAAQDSIASASKCRFGSRVVRLVPLFGAEVEVDELVDHSLARQRNKRKKRGSPSVFGYTHRTMDAVYGDPRFNQKILRDDAGRPVANLISAVRADASGLIELLVVTPDPDDQYVLDRVMAWADCFSISNNVPVHVHRNITHEAGLFAKAKWTPDDCPFGPCSGCEHPPIYS